MVMAAGTLNRQRQEVVDGDFHRAHVPLPPQVERFIRLPGLEDRYVTLETCVSICIHQLFPEFEINGKLEQLEIEKEYDDDLGVKFEEMKIRSCANDCVFCFVDQNPSNMRNSMYFRDGRAEKRRVKISSLLATGVRPKFHSVCAFVTVIACTGIRAAISMTRMLNHREA